MESGTTLSPWPRSSGGGERPLPKSESAAFDSACGRSTRHSRVGHPASRLRSTRSWFWAVSVSSLWAAGSPGEFARVSFWPDRSLPSRSSWGCTEGCSSPFWSAAADGVFPSLRIRFPRTFHHDPCAAWRRFVTEAAAWGGYGSRTTGCGFGGRGSTSISGEKTFGRKARCSRACGAGLRHRFGGQKASRSTRCSSRPA